jgi:16S rRNA (uracil1498-N3)-methyltransferase
MTRRRWIADRVSGNRAQLIGGNAEHLARVLRARPGQEFEISTGDTVRLGRVASVSDQVVEFELGAELPQDDLARTVLLLAIFKFDRMEWAIEKAAELGVSEIVPLAAHRSDPHLVEASHKRVERWTRIVHEAAQQARRVAAPRIAAPLRLRQAIQLPASTRVVLAENERGLLKDALQAAASDIALAVGPEGGWTPGELADFTHAGWTAASLGNHILRAETAAIAALAIVTSLR